jgi:5-(carboxyamino)imidazole ribonucleotide mutase
MLVGVVMGSKSDWDTMKFSGETLHRFGIPYERSVLSAHRSPDEMFEYAEKARGRLDCIIAGAGGAAHLPGMLASKTLVPVLGVPVHSAILAGVDSLLSIVQMPGGVPVATFAIGRAGAVNAAFFAMQMMVAKYPELEEKLVAHREAARKSSLNTNWE